MSTIRIAIIGVGNCATSLVQGTVYYGRRTGGKRPTVGVIHDSIGGYRVEDIEVVAAFDVDERKVGQPLHRALAAPPNCTMQLANHLPDFGVKVQMGPVLDGVAGHMSHYPTERTFIVSKRQPRDVTQVLKHSGAQIAVNYLPVGSERATRRYAESCLKAGVSLVNCMPVFLASDPLWGKRFERRGIPIVGDDIKAQIGATITHRTLAQLCHDRGIKIDRTYQLNTGGNTDFLNMLNRERLQSKKISKTEAVQALLNPRLPEEDIHIGPSDYVPWQRDNKVCFIRIEGRGFGDFPVTLELRLSVEDSPNSAGIGIDAIRCCQLARDRGLAGPLESVSAFAMKHPPKQHPDQQARQMVEDFIAGKRSN